MKEGEGGERLDAPARTDLTWAINGAIIPPMRLKDVQKPIPRERATVGYT